MVVTFARKITEINPIISIIVVTVANDIWINP
jgi:hypothetical protein